MVIFVRCSSWSQLAPLFSYGLILFLIVYHRYPLSNGLFSLLHLILAPHNSFILAVHMIYYNCLNPTDGNLVFLFSQSAFFHLVCINIGHFIFSLTALKGKVKAFVSSSIQRTILCRSSSHLAKSFLLHRFPMDLHISLGKRVLKRNSSVSFSC